MANFAFLSFRAGQIAYEGFIGAFSLERKNAAQKQIMTIKLQSRKSQKRDKRRQNCRLEQKLCGFFTMLSISLHKRGQPQLETDIITPPATLFCREMSTKLSWLMALLIQHAFWFAASVFYCSTNRSESDLNDIGPLCRCHYRGGADCEIVIVIGVAAPLV